MHNGQCTIHNAQCTILERALRAYLNRDEITRFCLRTDTNLLSNLLIKFVIRHKNPPTDETVGGFAAGRSPLARHEGFEPPTPWFVAKYSIQLS